MDPRHLAPCTLHLATWDNRSPGLQIGYRCSLPVGAPKQTVDSGCCKLGSALSNETKNCKKEQNQAQAWAQECRIELVLVALALLTKVPVVSSASFLELESRAYQTSSNTKRSILCSKPTILHTECRYGGHQHDGIAIQTAARLFVSSER